MNPLDESCNFLVKLHRHNNPWTIQEETQRGVYNHQHSLSMCIVQGHITKRVPGQDSRVA